MLPVGGAQVRMWAVISLCTDSQCQLLHLPQPGFRISGLARCKISCISSSPAGSALAAAWSQAHRTITKNEFCRCARELKASPSQVIQFSETAI